MFRYLAKYVKTLFGSELEQARLSSRSSTFDRRQKSVALENNPKSDKANL